MAQKAFAVGGIGAQPTVDDVVKVALGLHVALDPAGADRVKKASPPPKNFQAEQCDAASASDGNQLAAVQSRAIIATKLLQLMNGKSGVRVQVAEYLVALLNHGIVPALRAANSDDSTLVQLADACHGLGDLASDQPSFAAALSSASVEAPKLSSAERLMIQGGGAASAGIGALAVQGGKKLLTLATAAAALSYEAVGAQIKGLESEVMEAQGYKAAATAADEMRSLLEGSKRVGIMKAGEHDALPHAFLSAPQRLGAASEALAAAYTAVRSEVQAEALPPRGAGANAAPGNTVSPWLAGTLLELARALLAVAVDASARAARAGANLGAAGKDLADVLAAMSSGVALSMASAQQTLASVGSALLSDVAAPASPSVAAATAAAGALEAAQSAVALEALTAVVALRALEGPPPPAPAPGAEAAAAAAPAADGKEGKEKKKDRKGGASAGVVLGKGTTLVREFIEKAAAGGTAPALPTTPPAAPAAPEGGAAEGGDVKRGPPPLLLHGVGLEPGALVGVRDALSPLAPSTHKFLEELRAVVEANQARRKPKVPKGARDFLPDQMAIREAAFNIITAVFKRHGAVAIDTPVFELRETLMGKYGEDSKLIYDLADQGGEVLSLRYDLTVPFARYVAVNGVGNIKRYHIGKVYRRDQPQMNRGRFREFFQCDFDVAGSYATMVADSEVVKVLVEILSDLKLGEFEIKLNHRKLLDAMMQIAGVPPQKFRAICSAIDKLDKEPWEAVRAEMVDEKGLPPAVADRIGEFVVLRGEPLTLVEVLRADGHALAAHPESKEALEELKLLFTYLKAMGALGPVVLDLSLARGLDYYTGVIYEAVLKGGNVGSIAAGGRYDKLVGMFSGKDVPAVGVSIGIERVFAIMEAQVRERAAAAGRPVRATETEVLVASIGNDMQVKRMEIASRLWAAGIKAEFGFKPNPKMGDQLNHALEQAIPFMVLFGDAELQAGNVKVKDMAVKTEEVVSLANLEEELRTRIAAAAARGDVHPQPAPAAAEGQAEQ